MKADQSAPMPDLPLKERLAQLRKNGVTQFYIGTVVVDGKSLGGIAFICPKCPDEHILETFPSEAEAEVALELAFHDAGMKVQDGGKKK